MIHTQEEILNALKVIKETCKVHNTCKECPFSNEKGVCLICESSPVYYKLNDGTNIWRALK